jgi:uncharacterized protein
MTATKAASISLNRALAACALSLLTLAGPASAGPVPPKPDRYVTDASGVLPPPERDALEERLAAFDRETSNQLLVWIAPHVPEGTTPEELGADAIRAWGVGQAGRDNGIVFFVFTEDRKSRIATGYGMEGAVPDAVAKRIQAEQTRPHFARGDFAAGVRAGVDALIAATRGEMPVVRAPSLAEALGWRVRWVLLGAWAVLLAVGLLRRAPRVAVKWVAVWGALVNLAGFFVSLIPAWFLLLFLVPFVGPVFHRVRYGWRWAPNRWSNQEWDGEDLSSYWGSSRSSSSSGSSSSFGSSSSSSSSGFSGGGGDSGGGGASDDF